MTSSKTTSPTTTRTKPRTPRSAALPSTHRGGYCAAMSNIGHVWPCAVTNPSILRKGVYPQTCIKYTQISFKLAFKVHLGSLDYNGLWDIPQTASAMHSMLLEMKVNVSCQPTFKKVFGHLANLTQNLNLEILNVDFHKCIVCPKIVFWSHSLHYTKQINVRELHFFFFFFIKPPGNFCDIFCCYPEIE